MQSAIPVQPFALALAFTVTVTWNSGAGSSAAMLENDQFGLRSGPARRRLASIVDWRAAAIVGSGWYARAGWLTVLWRRRASVRTHIRVPFTRFSVAVALIHVAFPGIAVA